MLAEQQRHTEALTTEVQRKDITPARVARLMKIVSRNLEIIERLIHVVEAIAQQAGISTEKIDADLHTEMMRRQAEAQRLHRSEPN